MTAALLARRRALVASLVFVAAWLLAAAIFEIDVRFSDVPLFQRYGEAFADGQVPYRDIRPEYPPGALLVFWLPALVASDLDAYSLGFEALLVACGIGLLISMDLALTRLRAASLRHWGALLLVAATPLLLGRVVAERYDLWPAALMAAAVAAALGGRHRTAGAVLGLGAAAKLFPAALLPLLAIWAWRQTGRRAAVASIASFCAAVAAVFLPFLAASPGGVAEVFERQVERPLQLETLGSSLLLVAHHVAGLSLGVETSYGSANLGGTRADAVAALQTLLLAAVLLGVWIRFWRGRADADGFIAACAATAAAVVVLGKVLSPQFLVWILPLVPLVRGAAGARASALLATACVATHVLFPARYLDLIGLQGAPSAVLAVRNLLLAAMLVLIVRHFVRRVPARTEPNAGEHA